MGIYTTIYGKIECNVDELNEDFDINVHGIPSRKSMMKLLIFVGS